MSSNATIYRTGLVTALQALTLDGLPSVDVVARRRPWDENGVLRGLSVCDSDVITSSKQTMSREDIGYGFSLSLYIGSDTNTIESTDLVAQFEETIRKKIINRRLSVTLNTGDTNLITTVSHGKLNFPVESYRFELSTLFVRCWARESRTA